MPWRVTRVLNLKDRRLSVHAREEDAKADTAAQLAGLLETLAADMPGYATVWRYPERFPGFMEDAAEALDRIGETLSAGDVWAAYELWQAFMKRWERLPIPLWGQVGTVIVEGPGKEEPPAAIPRKMFRYRTRKVMTPEEAKAIDDIMRDLIESTVKSAEATITLEASLANMQIPHEDISAATQPILQDALKEVQSIEDAINYIGKLQDLTQRLETGLRAKFGLPEGGIEEWMRKHS